MSNQGTIKTKKVVSVDNKELYIKALNLVGKPELEKKQRNFLLRVIRDAECKAQNLSIDALKKNQAIEILNDLNNVCRTHFKDTETNLKLIYARFAEGFTVEEFLDVHRVKASQWLTTDFAKYLKPSTLYSTKHFEDYLNEALKKRSTAKPRNWKDYKNLPDLIANRIGLDIPEQVKRLYGVYSLAREHQEAERMENYKKQYKKLLEVL